MGWRNLADDLGVDRLGELTQLDRIVDPVRAAVQRAAKPPAVKDFLHGTWAGHPLHPALAQLTVGAWVGAAVLDLLRPGRDGSAAASTALVATGVASAVPTAAAGLVDWAELHEDQQRIGLVHAAINVGALTLYSASLVARLRGRHQVGRQIAYAGVALGGVGAMIGGHLSFRWAAGVNHNEHVFHVLDGGWHDIGRFDELDDGKPSRREIGEVALVALRRRDRVDVLVDRCSHLSGPLHEGAVSTVNGVTCLVCPWHDSAFAVDDGSVQRGPATAPQPRFEVRVLGGVVQVRGPLRAGG